MEISIGEGVRDNMDDSRISLFHNYPISRELPEDSQTAYNYILFSRTFDLICLFQTVYLLSLFFSQPAPFSSQWV